MLDEQDVRQLDRPMAHGHDGQKHPFFGTRSRRRGPSPVAVLLVVVLAVGLVAALLASQTNLDLRQFAWGGVRFGGGVFEQGRSPNLAALEEQAGEESGQKQLFHDLTQTYWDADVVNISLPEFSFSGVAFQAYDPDLGNSFVFARLENVPLVEGKVLRLWLEGDDGTFIAAGVPDIVVENGVPVAYFTTPLEGKLTQYKTLHATADDFATQLTPGDIFLSVDFEEEQS